MRQGRYLHNTKVWKGLGDRIKEFLKSVTIEDLKRELDELGGAATKDADPVKCDPKAAKKAAKAV